MFHVREEEHSCEKSVIHLVTESVTTPLGEIESGMKHNQVH